MASPLTAEDILPLVAGMAPNERARLLRLIAASSSIAAATAYAAEPPVVDEFSSDEEPLEWDAGGWEPLD